jgi:hypothetical protein
MTEVQDFPAARVGARHILAIVASHEHCFE